jgi:citrate lyase subunit beta / citryl-CoA lyase
MGSVGPFADFSDLEGLSRVAARSRALGFTCQACIHPAQVADHQRGIRPSPAEVDRARRLIAAFEAALAEGKGAVAFEGQMIDLPVVERARKLLARAK